MTYFKGVKSFSESPYFLFLFSVTNNHRKLTQFEKKKHFL